MPTRRDFISTLSTAAIAGAVGPLATGSSISKRDRGPICLFSKHLQWMEYEEMAETAAEIGFDGVSLTVRPRGHVLPENVERDLPRAVEFLKKAGLKAPMMTTAITDPTDPRTRAILEVASDLGIRFYRMGYFKYAQDKRILDSLAYHKGQLSELAALNKEYGIHGAYQNHSGTNVGGPVWDIHHLLDGLDPQWVGCQYDVRHATAEGGTSWTLGMKLLAPYIKITAMKDFHWIQDGNRWRIHNTPLGEGMVDFETYSEMTRSLGINGPISLHFEYDMPHETNNGDRAEVKKQTIAVMKQDVDFLKSQL